MAKKSDVQKAQEAFDKALSAQSSLAQDASQEDKDKAVRDLESAKADLDKANAEEDTTEPDSNGPLPMDETVRGGIYIVGGVKVNCDNEPVE